MASWSVQNAKARLSELLRLARKGQPQRIGIAEACIVISEADWAARQGKSLGEWLIDSAPRGQPFPEASRSSRRGDPFEQSNKRRRSR